MFGVLQVLFRQALVLSTRSQAAVETLATARGFGRHFGLRCSEYRPLDRAPPHILIDNVLDVGEAVADDLLEIDSVKFLVLDGCDGMLTEESVQAAVAAIFDKLEQPTVWVCTALSPHEVAADMELDSPTIVEL